MLTDDQGVDVARSHSESLSRVDAKAEGVKQRAGGEDPPVPGEGACQVGEWVRGIGPAYRTGRWLPQPSHSRRLSR